MLTNMSKKHPIILTSIVIFITSLLRAIAMVTFYVPNKIANGGASGIANIVNHLAPYVSVGTLIILINIPLIILAFIFINKIFTLKTLIATLLSSGLTDLLQFFVNKGWFVTFTDDMFVATLAGGILWGIALGLLLKVNCSTGGSDIAGLLFQNKFPNAKVVYLIFAVDFMVGTASGIVFQSFSLALYAITSIFVASFIADIVGRGIVSTVEFRIISDKHQEIADFIINNRKRSITAFRCTGMYTKADKFYMVCVVRKREVMEIKQKIEEIDPRAFYYICNVHEINGTGFDNTLNPSSKIK